LLIVVKRALGCKQSRAKVMTDFFAVSPHELAGLVECHRPGGVGALGTLKLFAEACRSEIDPKRGAIESCGAAHPVGIVVACRVRLAAPEMVCPDLKRCRADRQTEPCR
jgi:hypothetical protein